MKEIKQVLVYGTIFLSSVIGFIGSMLIVAFDPVDFILNVAGLFGILMFVLFVFSIIMLTKQIDEDEKGNINETFSIKKD